MRAETIVVLLFAISSVVALAARALRAPYTIALVVAGLTLGSLHVVLAPHLTRELLYAIFLPGLVFESAFHLEFRALWANRIAVFLLAVPGVAICMALVAVGLRAVAPSVGLAPNFGWGAALLFGALISATDPIAVVAVFRKIGAPSRLRVLLESESLINDGTAVVLFSLATGYAAGEQTTILQGALGFFEIVIGSAAFGAFAGYLFSKVIERIDDALVEITLTTLAAYGGFVLAEDLHLSGIIATLSCGIVCGSYGARIGMSATTRVAVESFWQYVAFALNSIVFLLIGFEIDIRSILAEFGPILAAFAILAVARAVIVFGVAGVLRRTRERLPWGWAVALSWGGLRGALSMVLVLAIPQTFAHKQELVNVTFGVVLLTLLVQGATVSPLLRLLRVDGGGAKLEDPDEEALRAKLLVAMGDARKHGLLGDDDYEQLVLSLEARRTERAARAPGASTPRPTWPPT